MSLETPTTLTGIIPYKNTLSFANEQDAQDKLAHMRACFHIPKQTNGNDEIYFCGNSLGLQPKKTQSYIDYELKQWRDYAVKGHFLGDFPWMPYHEFLAQGFADLVGANISEVVAMNSLTANLHFMMVSFYRPTPQRYKILIEAQAFPSDHYAAESQIQFHGYHPKNALITLKPREGEVALRKNDILNTIEEHGDSIALILLPGVQYYSGQVFDMATITKAGHKKGCKVGFDLAHAAGNIPLQLHEWQVDFACWCSYKYLNAGPGSVAGCFIHERYLSQSDLPRFAGWWGHDKTTRFKMDNQFQPMHSAEAWQLSNPPILSLAAIRATLDTFNQAGGISPLHKKSIQLTSYLRYLLKDQCGESLSIITPEQPGEFGCQLSLAIKSEKIDGAKVYERLEKSGVTVDWRHPNVIRAAPVPLYNTFKDCYIFVEVLKACIKDAQ